LLVQWLRREGESSVQVNISARHGHLSAETQQKIEEKVERLRRIFDRVTAIQVTADLEHREAPSVEVRLSAEHTADFVASESSTTVMAALDGVIRKIEQQLRKHKEKRREHRSQSLGRTEPPTEPESED
jgi:putative sigma-54 modulation protein